MKQKKPFILPTDTLWGIGAEYSQKGITQLNTLKNRPGGAPYVTCTTKQNWNQFLCASTHEIAPLIDYFWPGGLTIIAPVHKNWKGPKELLKKGNLAVRCPNHPCVINYINEHGPLLLTSCNTSGAPPLTDVNQICSQYPNLSVCDTSPPPLGIDSTIILFDKGIWRVIRVGAITEAELSTVLGYRPLANNPKTPFTFQNNIQYSSDGHPFNTEITTLGWANQTYPSCPSYTVNSMSELYPIINKLKNQKLWVDTATNTPFAGVRSYKKPINTSTLVLGIETSCDDSSIALVKNGTELIGMETKDQYEVHKPYGGVFPELASRAHSQCLVPLLDTLLKKTQYSLKEIDAIAVTTAPGLIGSLLTGVTMAKMLALTLKKPLIPVNHVKAHLYAPHLEYSAIQYPALGLVVSGGHTFMAYLEDPIHMTLLGTTCDDAIGEAFDKVGKLLGWQYPQGPIIEQWAKKGDPLKYNFSPGIVKKNRLAFSYSGLKTQVLYALKGQNAAFSPCAVDDTTKADICASFQRVAFNDLLKKCQLALEKHQLSSIIIGGGVAASTTLKNLLTASLPGINIYQTSPSLAQDNGAMIAGLGYQLFKSFEAHPSIESIQPKARTAF